MTPAEITDAGAAYSAGIADATQRLAYDKSFEWRVKGVHAWRAYLNGYDYGLQCRADADTDNDLI